MLNASTSTQNKRPKLALISQAPPGSLGDQAMLDVVTTKLGKKTAITIFPFSTNLRTEVRTISARGRGALVRSAILASARADYVVMTGADMIDGAYSAKASMKMLRVLQAAHFLGRRVRIFGSSWSNAADPRVESLFRNAQWLDVLARDRLSQARMETAFDRPIPLVADVAFLLEPEAQSAAAQSTLIWLQAARTAGDTVLAVNLSGHTVDAMPERSIVPLSHLVSRWLDANPKRRCLILPHDTRKGYVGDLKVNGELFDCIRQTYGERVKYVDGAINAWDAKAIVGEVDLVLTGRMHLAIASLGMGTPPVCFGYMDKFEGLMDHFSLENMMLPKEQLGDQSYAHLEHVSKNVAGLRTEILSRLPVVKEMSRKNFDGLGAPE